MNAIADLYRSRVSMATRSNIALRRVELRRATARFRRPAEILVIGTQRGGTSSLFRFLAAHPDIRRPLRKEIEYLGRDYKQGPAWYRAHFPIRRQAHKSMDCTPQYLFHPHSAQRAAQVVPDAQIVVLLRNPIKRAHSHWRHMTTLGIESLPFAEAIDAEPQRTNELWQRMVEDQEFWSADVMNFSYIRRGQYADHLDLWREHFSDDQLLLIETERLLTQSGETLGEIERFLGLGETRTPSLANASRPHSAGGDSLTPELVERLQPLFTKSNDRLRSAGWQSSWL